MVKLCILEKRTTRDKEGRKKYECLHFLTKDQIWNLLQEECDSRPSVTGSQTLNTSHPAHLAAICSLRGNLHNKKEPFLPKLCWKISAVKMDLIKTVDYSVTFKY